MTMISNRNKDMGWNNFNNSYNNNSRSMVSINK